MRLAEHGDGTRMELRFSFDSIDGMRELERMGTFEGIVRSVGQMDALLGDIQETHLR